VFHDVKLRVNDTSLRRVHLAEHVEFL
jgi:hypothetical protein